MEKDLTMEIPDSEKTPDYIKRMAASIVMRHSRTQYQTVVPPSNPVQRNDSGDTPLIWHNVENARLARRFSRGSLGGEDYKRRMTLRDSSDQPLEDRKMVWETLKIPAKYMAIAVDMMMRPIRLRVEVMDPDVRDKASTEKFEMLGRVKSTMDPRFKAAVSRMMPDAATMPPNLPQSESEWSEWATGIYRDDVSRTIEIMVNAAKSLNSYDLVIRPRIAEELRDAGISVVMVTLDPCSMTPVIEQVPYENCILPNTVDNWETMRIGAVRREMTIDQIALDCQGEIPMEKLKELAKRGNNDWTLTHGVWTVWFIDHLHKTTGTDKDGMRVEVEYGADTSGLSDVLVKRYEIVHECKLVEAVGLGTSGDRRSPWENNFLAYGAGQAKNQVRMRDSKTRAMIPLIACAVDMTEMRVRSMAQRAMDAFEPFNTLWFRFKQLTRKIIPPGFALDESFVTNPISLSEPGGTVSFHLKDHINNILDDGLVITRSTTYDNPSGSPSEKSQKLPIHPGAIPQFREILDAMSGVLNLFEQTLGFNEATAARDTAERASVRGLQMIAEATNSALSPWHRAMDTIETKINRYCYGAWQNAYRANGKTRRMAGQIFGDAVERNVELTLDNDAESAGFHITLGATQQQLQEFSMAMDSAIAADPTSLTVGDKLYVLEVAKSNISVAASILDKRIQRNRDRAQENQKQMIQMDQQKVQMSAEANMQQMMAKFQADAELKMRLDESTRQHQKEIEALRSELEKQRNEHKAMLEAMLRGEEMDHEENLETIATDSAERIGRESVAGSEREARIKANATVEAAKIGAESRKNRPAKKG